MTFQSIFSTWTRKPTRRPIHFISFFCFTSIHFVQPERNLTIHFFSIIEKKYHWENFSKFSTFSSKSSVVFFFFLSTVIKMNVIFLNLSNWNNCLKDYRDDLLREGRRKSREIQNEGKFRFFQLNSSKLDALRKWYQTSFIPPFNL